LPVVNPKAFILALEAATQSVSEDLEAICRSIGVTQDLPEAEDPLRFQRLIEALFNAFPLKKDPSYVDQFMMDCWPRLRLLMPGDIANLPEEVVADFLRGHLKRVIANQKAHHKINLHSAVNHSKKEWYSFGEDFIYDTFPMSTDLIDQRNLDFPLHEAAKQMKSILGMFEVGDESLVDSISWRK